MRVFQGPRALTQRSPRSGRFAAMRRRVQPREVHQRRGLAQPPSLGRAKDEEIYVGVDAIIVSILSFETRCSISASSPV